MGDRRLRELQVKQYIRKEGPEAHQKKAGTPTMGGVLIVAAIAIPTLLWADLAQSVRDAGGWRDDGVRRDRVRRRLQQSGAAAESRASRPNEKFFFQVLDLRGGRRGAARTASARRVFDGVERAVFQAAASRSW